MPKSLYLSTIDEQLAVDSTGTGGIAHKSLTGANGGPSSSSSAPNSSLYKSVDLKPGQLYELVLRNDDPKSVLTWDFDVVTGCMQFTVFRTGQQMVVQIVSGEFYHENLDLDLLTYL